MLGGDHRCVIRERAFEKGDIRTQGRERTTLETEGKDRARIPGEMVALASDRCQLRHREGKGGEISEKTGNGKSHGKCVFTCFSPGGLVAALSPMSQSSWEVTGPWTAAGTLSPYSHLGPASPSRALPAFLLLPHSLVGGHHSVPHACGRREMTGWLLSLRTLPRCQVKLCITGKGLRNNRALGNFSPKSFVKSSDLLRHVPLYRYNQSMEE